MEGPKQPEGSADAASSSASSKKDKKAPPAGLVIPPKKPKLTKAERRALQEQQRAAKQQQQSQSGQQSGQQKQQQKQAGQQKPKQQQQHNQPKKSQQQHAAPSSSSSNMTAWVSHLPRYQDVSTKFGPAVGATYRTTAATGGSGGKTTTEEHHFENLHPAVLELGYQYAAGRQVQGGNARCRAMLECFATVLTDVEPPSSDKGDVRPWLDANVLKPAFSFWTQHCRPHSVPMGNAFSFLKAAVAALPRDESWPEQRTTLLETLQQYQQERIEVADQAIASLACQQLLNKEDGEVLLVYGYSEVISVILQQAATTTTTLNFRVIVVDSRPWWEGRRMLQELRAAGIECTYILLNALTYVLQDVTKVLLGASALMSDGSVVGRVGTAMIALAASQLQLPVLVCAETYKISNRVQLESLTHNELGNPQDLLPSNNDDNKDNNLPPNLQALPLLYDLCPASFISGVVTELGIVPPTSVAVLLREMNPQESNFY